jgi:hypothetical protein
VAHDLINNLSKENMATTDLDIEPTAAKVDLWGLWE